MLPQAIRELSESFQPYKAVSRISQCRRRIIEIQGELKARLDEDFDALYGHSYFDSTS